jgi:hypothetical protein
MSLSQDYLARGLSLDAALANGAQIDTAPVRQIVEQRLGPGCPPLWEFSEEIIWFPICDVAGRVKSWIARPLPRQDASFVFPVGSNKPPFIPSRAYEVAADPAVPLIFTQGPVKALACTLSGIPAIGLHEGCSERTPEEQLGLRSELRQFKLAGRRVYFCFDARADVDPPHRRLSVRLFLLLSAAGADVRQFTSWDVGEGQGIDDFLVGSMKEDPGESAANLLTLLANDATRFMDTIEATKIDLDAVVAELVSVKLDGLYRAQLCKKLAKRLKVPASDLRKVVQNKSDDAECALDFEKVLERWPDAVDGALLLHSLTKS